MIVVMQPAANKEQVEIPALIYPLIKAFNGERSTVEVFHLGFNILFNLTSTVDKLRQNNILITA